MGSKHAGMSFRWLRYVTAAGVLVVLAVSFLALSGGLGAIDDGPGAVRPEGCDLMARVVGDPACLDGLPAIARDQAEPVVESDALEPVFCDQGGISGPSFDESLHFAQALPPPPLTLAASIKTTQMGGFQVIASWGGPMSCVEFRLENGNLVYGEVNQGWFSVRAEPALDLRDGSWHTVAVVRAADGSVLLFCDGQPVGRGQLPWDAVPPDLGEEARSARIGGGKNDLVFDGWVERLNIWSADIGDDALSQMRQAPDCQHREAVGAAASVGGCTFTEGILYGTAQTQTTGPAQKIEDSAYSCARNCKLQERMPYFSYEVSAQTCLCKDSDTPEQPDQRFVSGPSCTLEHAALLKSPRPTGTQWMQVAFLTEKDHLRPSRMGDTVEFSVPGSKLSDSEINAHSWNILKFVPQDTTLPVTYFKFNNVTFDSMAARWPTPYALTEQDALSKQWTTDPCRDKKVINFGRGHCAYTVKSAYGYSSNGELPAQGGPVVGDGGVQTGGVRLFVNVRVIWKPVALISDVSHLTAQRRGDLSSGTAGSKLSDDEINEIAWDILKFAPLDRSYPAVYFDFSFMRFDSTAARKVTPYALTEEDALLGRWLEEPCSSLTVVNFGRSHCEKGAAFAYGVRDGGGAPADRGPVLLDKNRPGESKASDFRMGAVQLFVNARGLKTARQRTAQESCPPLSAVAGRCGKSFGRCNALLSAGSLFCDESVTWCRGSPGGTDQQMGTYNFKAANDCPPDAPATQEVRMANYVFPLDPSVQCEKKGRCSCSQKDEVWTKAIGIDKCKERCLANKACVMVWCDGATMPCTCHEYTEKSCTSTRFTTFAGIHWRKTTLPAERLPPKKGICEDVAFIRIQKTGSSSFGEAVIPKMCAASGMFHRSFWHMDYSWATYSSNGCAVTLLRDPYTRFVSEFTMLRGPEATRSMEQDQWDTTLQDLPKLRSLMTKQPMSEAMVEYLEWPGSPGRNRQALYMLGFKRVACDRGCCGVCTREYKHPYGRPKRLPEPKDGNKIDTGGYPAKQYDWERDHDALLARAQEHLLGIRAFGFTECFPESLRVIAQEVGWDPEQTLALAKRSHARSQARGQNDPIKIAAQKLEGRIRQVNRLDDELWKWGLDRFYERYGVKCGKGE